jgi:hypothetical protein
MTKSTKHLPHYLSLYGIFAAALVGFIVFTYDRDFQVAIAISVSAAYFVWGVVHHSIHKDLDVKVVIEYLVIALFGMVALLGLIYRS